MRLKLHSHLLARHATIIALAALLIPAAGCGGGASEPSTNESASTPVVTSPAATPTIEDDTAYCAELYEFHVMVNTFVADAYGNMPMAEPLTTDELIAEADRLSQWAIDLSITTPPDVAEALVVLSEALAAASEGFAGGLENWEAMLPASESEIRDERDIIGAAATLGDCA
jgi:hypothetical protein